MERNLSERAIRAIETLPYCEKMVPALYYQEELNLKEIGAEVVVGRPAFANCTVK